jgi:hypothetical protein
VASRAQSWPDAPVLSPVQERVVEQLRRDGVAIVPFAELFADDARWEQAAADIGEFVAGTEALLPSMSHDDRVAAFGKAFLVRRYRVKKGEDRPTFGLDNPWVSMGASAQFLGIVNAYRGEPMRLHDIDNWYTVPDAEAARSASQRWHRDGWENHIVKVFTYFNDVDEEAGPFEYILGSAAGGRYGSLWPWEDKEVYPPQDELEAAVDATDCRSLTGGPGSIVFCDTSGFHRGGFARTRPRILSYHTYLSDTGQQHHRRKFDVEVDVAELDEQSAYALG